MKPVLRFGGEGYGINVCPATGKFTVLGDNVLVAGCVLRQPAERFESITILTSTERNGKFYRATKTFDNAIAAQKYLGSIFRRVTVVVVYAGIVDDLIPG